MKKWILYFAMSCLIPAVINAQLKKTIMRAPINHVNGIEPVPDNKNLCAGSKCPTGMSCDGTCCMYPTNETIGQLNYIIYNKCDAMKDLHFKFEVTKELTAEYDELTSNCDASKITQKLNSTAGIVIQFNCFSKDAPNALIQYLFYVQGTDIWPHIQYAGGTPDKVDHDWTKTDVNNYGLTLAKPNSLAKGFVLEVELSSDDKGYVNGATFTVTEPNGKKHVQKAGKDDVFPVRISEFQTNIVSTDGHYVHFGKDGAGTLSYSSKDALCVEGGNYEHCAAAAHDYGGGTCETSNAKYGKLSSCCSKPGDSFSQSVTVQ